MTSKSAASLEKATFAGGCFWCLEPLFAELEGVDDVVVGYTGGQVQDPTYQQVCSGRTGHAEAIQVTFDPGRIAYRDLVQVFFSLHDPTTRDRQGADVGSQYRSAVFTHSPDQVAIAQEVVQAMTDQHVWSGPVVTQIEPVRTFFPAEEYHQEYYEKNPGAGYCQVVVAPKLSKFRQHFAAKLKSTTP
ncbi:MAG: peptide-methionine (S)-S-oxide reductase MsrA [Anaerolineales bacterium]